MSRRPPFNMLRACFYLLAGTIAVELTMTSFAGLTCWYGNVFISEKPTIGACLPIIAQIREQWGEIVAAILALLLAALSSRPPPPPNGGKNGTDNELDPHSK
jgi:hypothetical protein